MLKVEQPDALVVAPGGVDVGIDHGLGDELLDDGVETSPGTSNPMGPIASQEAVGGLDLNPTILLHVLVHDFARERPLVPVGTQVLQFGGSGMGGVGFFRPLDPDSVGDVKMGGLLDQVRRDENFDWIHRPIGSHLDPVVVGSLIIDQENPLGYAGLRWQRCIRHRDGVAHPLMVGAEVKEVGGGFGIGLKNDLSGRGAVVDDTETVGASLRFEPDGEGVVGGTGAVKVEGDDVASCNGQSWLGLAV